MRKTGLLLAAFIVATVLMVPALAAARPGPGLGVFTGAKINLEKNIDGGLDPTYNFGFLVDIPLVNTFHLTPSADTYTIGKNAVTDLGLAFKFIVPLRMARPYGALAMGMTTFANERDFHVGGALGTYIRLVANLDAMVQVEYKRMMINKHDIKELEGGSLHGQVGLLFRF